MSNRSDVNTYTDNVENYEEGIEILVGESVFDSDNESDIVKKIQSRKKKEMDNYNRLSKRTDINRAYWRGDQINEDDLYEGENKRVVNKVFQSVETIVPIITRKTPEPIVTIIPRSQKTLNLQQKTSLYLKDQWEIVDKMQQQQQVSVRNLINSGYTFGKYYWDEDENRAGHVVVPPKAIIFPKTAKSVEDAPFIIEFVRSSIKSLKTNFPEKADEIDKKMRFKSGASEDSIITYLEYWEDHKVCWIFEDIYLGSRKNPHYDYENPKKNHFRKPKKPYILMNFLNFGESIADETTLVEQVLTLQDGINKRKRQIELNAEFANGKWIAAGNSMDREDFDNIDTDTHKIYLDGADTISGAIDVFYGRGMDSGVYNDMSHSEGEIDNIFGTHSTTRGERETQETATGRAILKESDYGRIDLITRNYEQYAEDYYDANIQLLKVHLDTQHPLHSLPSDNDPTRLSQKDKETYIISDDYDDYKVKVLVKSGSAAPRDEIVEKSEAIELTTRGLMSLEDMYDILGYSNPKKMARNAFLQQNQPDLLFPELTNPEKFEPFAILHTEIIQNYEEGDNIDIQPFDSKDIESYQKHIDTHNDYLRGIEIDDNLVPFDDLEIGYKQVLAQHIEQETLILEEMIRAEDEKRAAMGQPTMEEEAMMQQQAQQPPQPVQPETVEQGLEVIQ